MPNPHDRVGQGGHARELQRIAGEFAGRIVAAVSRYGLEVAGQIVGSATGDGVRAVVFLVPDDRWTMTAEQAAAIAAVMNRSSAVPNVAPQHVAPQRPATAHPSQLDIEILALLRREGRPVKAAIIALRLRREGSYVRRRLAKLKADGKIKRAETGGYELA